MRDIVKEKLDIIFKLYPKERIERSKGRWRAVWQGGELDRVPFVYYSPYFNPWDDLHSGEERLMASLDEMIIRGHLNDDFIPSFFCGCRQATIPNMFGAKEIIASNSSSCEKIMSCIEDVDRLPRHSMGKGSVSKFFLDMQRYLVDETDGQIPVHVADMQGPFDVAGQLLGYDKLFVAAYENEEKYRELMEKLTAAYIDFWRAQERVLGELFIPTHLFAWDYVERGLGASMSVDSLVMVSPDFYDEFYKPFLEKISREMGGLFVHSCGNFAHVIPSLMKTEGLRAVNASQMTLDELCSAGLTNDKVAILMVFANQLKDFFEDRKRLRMSTDMSVLGAFDGVFGGKIPLYSEWTKEQIEKVKKIDDEICMAAFLGV